MAITVEYPRNLGDCLTLLQSYYMTKPQPIDVRFVIPSVANVDYYIIPEHRYPGLIFFAVNENTFYYFDSSNDSNPKPLFESLANNIVTVLNGFENAFSGNYNINPGQIVYLKNPGVNIQRLPDEAGRPKYQYHSGVLKPNTIQEFNELPDWLKPENGRVEIGSNVYTITKEKTLEPNNTIYNNESEVQNPIEGKVYKIGTDYKLYTPHGEWVDLGSKTVKLLFNVQPGDNTIVNSLETDQILIEAWYNNNPVYFDYEVTRESIKFESRSYIRNCNFKISKI